MKKKRLCLVCVCVLLLLSACGGKPKGMSDDTYELGQKALKIMEQYDKADLSKDEAQERIEVIKNRLDELEFGDDIPASSKNRLVTVDVINFYYSLETDPEQIKDIISSLKQHLSK